MDKEIIILILELSLIISIVGVITNKYHQKTEQYKIQLEIKKLKYKSDTGVIK